MRSIIRVIVLVCITVGCHGQEKAGFGSLIKDEPAIQGKQEYLYSPFLTAGDRVYLVGHQNGSFPELGWHIKDEMGGIWNHPIKLMDGFKIDLLWEDGTYPLNDAHLFTNYPFANKHSFTIQKKNIEVERWQFVPDGKQGLVVQLKLKNDGTTRQNFKLRFTGNADLRPTWLGERTELLDYPDKATLRQEIDGWMVKDSLNPWFVIYGSDEQLKSHQSATSDYAGKGISNSLDYTVTLVGNSSKIINFIIAGSYNSREDALNTYRDIQSNIIPYFKEKQSRYKKLASRSKLSIPDKKIQEAFEWLKYNSDWMVRTVPEIGTGIAAGIPDYPWWFGADSEYALKGYMAIGQHEVVYKTIQLVDSLSTSTNGNGRIIHEASTNGAVFNKGNINETPQFASLIWEVYQWNGDKEFLEKYFPTVKMGLNWLLSENDANNNLLPDGFGMMEIHGLDSEMIDVAAYTQKAFADASQMARELGDQELSLTYENTANTLKEKINTEFWSDEFNSFADFIGTDEQALKLIEDAIIRADTLHKPWAVKELNDTREYIMSNPSKNSRPFVLHHNWVVNTPMEMGIADNPKALKALETAEKFVNPFGVFVTGIDRDESAGSDEGSFKGSEIFSYTGAVMTLPTGVQTVAENNYGRPNQALNYLKRMTRTFSYALPGSMYEVSPDYGMMTQAWNIYGYAVPIVQQFFGINPKAAEKKIVIAPQMPDEWDDASLENVVIGDNQVSVFYSNINGLLKLKVDQQQPDWTMKILFPVRQGDLTYELIESSVKPVIIEGKMVFTSQRATTELVFRVGKQ